MDHSPGFLKLVQDSKKGVKETDAARVKARLERGDKFILVDVREDNEWDKGRIPGARHLGRGVIERDIEATVPDKSSELILYCGGGFRSALAADVLQNMGYTNVWSMAGGWKAWQESGAPVE